MQQAIASRIAGTATMIRFLSRVSLPAPPRFGEPAFGWALRMAPLAGGILALTPACLIAVGVAVGLGNWLAASGAVLGWVWFTRALHEDGLADVADGFGGGATPARRLEIMRDSRIGSYGTLVICGSILLRVACVQRLLATGGSTTAVAALVAVASISRAAMLVPMWRLPPARGDGLAQGAGPVGRRALVEAWFWAAVVVAAVWLSAGGSSIRYAAAGASAAAASLAVTRMARTKVGGVTGDVAGATQQVSEVAALLTLCAANLPL